MRKKWFTLVLIFGFSPAWFQAAMPNSFTYQGSLKQNGTIVNGPTPMEFRITNADGSVLYWTSGAVNISVIEGLYKVELTPTTMNWATAQPYMEVRVAGTTLLPREKINSTAYSLMSKDLDGGGVARGNFSVNGRLGVGTESPETKLNVVETSPAANQNLIQFSAEAPPGGNPLKLMMGYRNGITALQAAQTTGGYAPLLVNPYGGNVGINQSNPPAVLTIRDNNGSLVGNTSNLFGAGYSMGSVMDGNRQVLIQQWFNNNTARSFLVGNGYVTGNPTTAVANNAPYAPFQALEFNDQWFGFVINKNGTPYSAATVDPRNGNLSVGIENDSEKLNVNGNIKVHGQLISEQNKPAFLVSVLYDDCGWPRPYSGCPAGYVITGQWHTGPGRCDGVIEGSGFENGDLDSGWMAMCSAQ